MDGRIDKSNSTFDLSPPPLVVEVCVHHWGSPCCPQNVFVLNQPFSIASCHTHAHTRTHAHTHAHIHAHTHTNAHTHARTHTQTHTQTHTHTFLVNLIPAIWAPVEPNAASKCFYRRTTTRRAQSASARPFRRCRSGSRGSMVQT